MSTASPRVRVRVRVGVRVRVRDRARVRVGIRVEHGFAQLARGMGALYISPISPLISPISRPYLP